MSLLWGPGVKVKFLCPGPLNSTIGVPHCHRRKCDQERSLPFEGKWHGQPGSSATLALGPGAGAVSWIGLGASAMQCAINALSVHTMLTVRVISAAAAQGFGLRPILCVWLGAPESPHWKHKICAASGIPTSHTPRMPYTSVNMLVGSPGCVFATIYKFC